MCATKGQARLVTLFHGKARSTAPAPAAANQQPREIIHYLRPGFLQVHPFTPSPLNILARLWLTLLKGRRDQVTDEHQLQRFFSAVSCPAVDHLKTPTLPSPAFTASCLSSTSITIPLLTPPSLPSSSTAAWETSRTCLISPSHARPTSSGHRTLTRNYDLTSAPPFTYDPHHPPPSCSTTSDPRPSFCSATARRTLESNPRSAWRTLPSLHNTKQ